MFFYDKKVIYLHMVRDSITQGSAGFVKLEIREREQEMHIQIQTEIPSGRFPVYGIVERMNSLGQVLLGNILIYNGKGQTKIKYNGVETLAELEVMVSPHCVIQGFIQDKSRIEQVELKSAEHKEKHYSSVWEYLIEHYAQVHPYGDERCYVSITLKELELLSENYRGLEKNSFLLHGFYNYGHLILGPEMEGNNQYFVGVPGVYYEREKLVALMFGFEAFECEGESQMAKFGYYLKRVAMDSGKILKS